MIKSSNVPTMSAGKVVKELSKIYETVINGKMPLKSVPSAMLWGAPGVGKSQAVRQIASQLERTTGKKVVVTDVRLLLFNPIDLRGIPTANADKTLAVWLKPQIFNMNPSDKVVNILFLDELSSAPQSVQAAAYQIALDRVIGEHKLPENCIVIGAGNRVTDRSVAFKMPRALANRLMHFEVEASVSAWIEWAIRYGVNDKVLGYISFRNDALVTDAEKSADDLAFATPRSWEMVSNILNLTGGSVDDNYQFIAGLIGVGNAIDFRTWAQVYSQLPKVEDIFAGKTAQVPKNSDALYALISSMVCYAREHRNEMGKIANSIEYANRLPADFSAVLLKDYMYIEEDYKKRLMTIPSFSRWLQSKGKLLNG
ncbi:MAG: AAA family ATPase [Clostridia bacterium]|nr:AAA family ATPase [Clostridia bacterium]